MPLSPRYKCIRKLNILKKYSILIFSFKTTSLSLNLNAALDFAFHAIFAAIFEVFVCKTSLTFLAFFLQNWQRGVSKGFKKMEVPQVGIELTTLTIPSLEVWYSLAVIICHARVAEWNRHLTSEPVMVSVVGSIPSGGNIIFFAKTFLKSLDVNFVPKCQNCAVNKIKLAIFCSTNLLKSTPVGSPSQFWETWHSTSVRWSLGGNNGYILL